MKAYTEPIYSTKRSRRRLVVVSLLVIIGFLSVLYIIKNKENDLSFTADNEKFCVLLKEFKNETDNQDLSPKIDYLITESLNQFNEFKVINESIVSSIVRSSAISDQDPEKIDKNYSKTDKLKEKFNVKYELRGRLSYFNDIFNIDAVLSSYGKRSRSSSITIPGRSKHSFLNHQIDTLVKRIYQKFFPNRKFEIKKLSSIFGNHWNTYSNFYRGIKFKNKFILDKAESFLLKSKDILMAKYFLADLYYFNSNRIKSLNYINDIIPKINDLTDSQKFRILALRARLHFNFNEEIENLEILKNEYQFSKELFYDLGEAYFHHGNAKKALWYYQKALELDKNYSKAMNHLGYCFSYMGDHIKAIESFEEYRNLDKSANSFDSLGDGYFYAGEWISAEAFKEAAVSKSEKSVSWAYLTLADINIIKANFNKAYDYLEKYSKLRNSKETRGEVIAKKAFIYFIEQKYKKALTVINQSIDTFDSTDINDNTAEKHWLKGFILIQLNNISEVKKELEWLERFKDKYKLSIENFSIPFKYYLHLKALLLEAEGKFVEAKQTFESLVEMKTQLSYWITYYNYQFFHTEYAHFLVRIGRLKEALSEINNCLDFNQKYIPALWIKAKILEKSKDRKRIDIYEKISEIYGISKEKNTLRNLLSRKMVKKSARR